MTSKAKVFGVGLGRTGTQSLAAALRKLGYSVIHYPFTLHDIAIHDAALDIPVAKRFRVLDALFPASKFLLTTRDEGPWLRSCENHYSIAWRSKPPGELTSLQQEVAETDFQVYGSWAFNRDLFLTAKREHEAAVKAHFAGRPDDLLTLDICNTRGEDTWKALVTFLGLPMKDFNFRMAFPWENRSEATDS